MIPRNDVLQADVQLANGKQLLVRAENAVEMAHAAGALLVSFWTLAVPSKVGMTTAFVLGLAEDVLYGTLLGQNALVLTLITFLVLSLQQRLRMFPMWQQSLVILVIFGIAQLIQLWLSALTGNRLPTLALVWSAVISALLWPWISFALRDLRRRLHIN